MSNCGCQPCGITSIAKKIYIGGPYNNDGQKFVQNKIATFLQAYGFTTYLPQRDGLDIQKVYNKLILQGKTAAEAQVLAPQIVYQYEIFNLAKCALVVGNVNEVDSGSSAILSAAFSMCMPIILYKDSNTWYDNIFEIDPTLLTLTTFPIVRKIVNLLPAITAALPKKDCKCISQAMQNVIKAGSMINKSTYK
jgi:Ca2+/Na+ antiporter